MKTRLQYFLITIAIIALMYGVAKISEITTMILPTWFVVLCIASVTCAISVGLGFAIKHVFKSGLYVVTFASIFMIIFVSIYSFVEYKPTLKILIPASFFGEVKLVVKNDPIENGSILVNKNGIGYLTAKDYSSGFYPKIIKGGKDITKQIKEYSKAKLAVSLNDDYVLNYLIFEVPGGANNLNYDIRNLLTTGAIDTMLLPPCSR